MVRRWRYRLAPDPLKRKPKGVCLLGAGAAPAWSWWPWAAVCLWTLVNDQWGWAIGRRRDGAGQLPDRAGGFPPRYGLDHEFSVEDEEFLPTDGGRDRRAVPARQPHRHPEQRRRFYPAMLEAIERRRAARSPIEAYIYWAGDIGRRSRRRSRRRRKAGVQVKILLDAVGSATIGEEILQILERGRCQLAWYNPMRWYSPGALQPPHPSQVADHRRPGRVHRRRRHRRPLAGKRARIPALARHADPDRGAGGNAAADRLRAELAADDRRADLGAAVLSADRRRPVRWRRRRS